MYISNFCAGFGMDKGNYLTTLIPVTLCIISFLFLYYKVEKNISFEKINKMFGQKLKTSTLFIMMLRLSGIIVVIIIAVMQLYRLNKWWLREFKVNSNILDSSPLISDIFGIVVGVPFLMLITLIPTFILFDVDIYVKGNIIKQYPEEFRKAYDFTKEEWYGDE